jgi:Rrf2 family nitric oxide-sensitive transcriptional repressor
VLVFAGLTCDIRSSIQADTPALVPWAWRNGGSEENARMRLTVFTDYTLRTLIYLALRPDRLSTISEIAAAYGISANHLMKVVQDLAQAGDVATLRGQRGGLRLARRPTEINLGAVVRRSEPDLHLVPCFGADACCAIQPHCVLATAFDEALKAFLAVLDRYTLADLVVDPAPLATLLGVNDIPAREGPVAATRRIPRAVSGK